MSEERKKERKKKRKKDVKRERNNERDTRTVLQLLSKPLKTMHSVGDMFDSVVSGSDHLVHHSCQCYSVTKQKERLINGKQCTAICLCLYRNNALFFETSKRNQRLASTAHDKTKIETLNLQNKGLE